jgi:hypothetical protein
MKIAARARYCLNSDTGRADKLGNLPKIARYVSASGRNVVAQPLACLWLFNSLEK